MINQKKSRYFNKTTLLFPIIILAVSLFITGCGQADQYQLAEQLSEMNSKIDSLSEENKELKEKISQQDPKQEIVEEPVEKDIWNYINLFADGSGDFNTIDEAVDKIEPGGIIFLNQGNYYPDANLLIDRSLSLMGSGSDTTKIIYSNQPNIIEYAGEGSLSISGIEFIREGIEWGDVIWIKSGQIDISDCTISGATHFEKEEEGSVGGGMGILIWGDGTKGIIQNCIIKNNSIDGIHIRHKSRIHVIDNEVISNMQYGVSYWDSSGGIAESNDCSGNTESGLAVRGLESSPLFIENTCNNNGYSGIDLYGDMSVTAIQNTCSENIYHGISVGGYSHANLLKNICHTNKEVGIVFFEESSGAVISNECYGNEYGIYIQPDASPDLIDNILENNTVEDIKDKR